MWESLDPKNDPDNWDGAGRYESPPPMRCYACDAIAQRVAAYEKSDRKEALVFRAELKPRTT